MVLLYWFTYTLSELVALVALVALPAVVADVAVVALPDKAPINVVADIVLSFG